MGRVRWFFQSNGGLSLRFLFPESCRLLRERRCVLEVLEHVKSARVVSKYTCPSCLIPYCSLVCFKIHKAASPTKEVPVEKPVCVEEANVAVEKSRHKAIDLLNKTSVPQTPLFTSQVNTPGAPMFSFQNIDDSGVEENSPEAAREARRRWSVLEDGVLVSAWLNTSKDAIVGNEQKAGAFWKRVAAYFAASPAIKDLQKREWNNCKQRWGKINEFVLKFCGC